MHTFSGGASLDTSVVFVVKLKHFLSLIPQYLMNFGLISFVLQYVISIPMTMIGYVKEPTI